MNTEIDREPSGETVNRIIINTEPKDVQANKTTEDVLMDYEKLAEAQGDPPHPENAPLHIGLAGGQSKYDEGGIDVDQYAGHESVPSTEYKNPSAPYHSGPDNGMHNQANPKTDQPEDIH